MFVVSDADGDGWEFWVPSVRGHTWRWAGVLGAEDSREDADVEGGKIWVERLREGAAVNGMHAISYNCRHLNKTHSAAEASRGHVLTQNFEWSLAMYLPTLPPRQA
eukprot:s2315_g12.t2